MGDVLKQYREQFSALLLLCYDCILYCIFKSNSLTPNITNDILNIQGMNTYLFFAYINLE